MRALFLTLLLLVPLFPNAAAAAMIPERQKLFTAGRYAELEKLMDREIGDDPKPKSAKLMFRCAAYSKLKRYDKLFPCLAKLEDNIRNGDTDMNDMEEMAKDSPFLTSMARLGAAGGELALKGTVVPFAHLMLSEAYNELRDYPKAVAAARAATAAIPLGLSIERSMRIMALTSQGLAEGFGGNREEAVKIAVELAAIDTSYPYSLLAADKWHGVARIYVSVGDFVKANEALREDTRSLIGSLAVGLADAIAGMDVGDSLFSYVELPKEFLLYKTQFEIGQVKEAKQGFDKLLADKRTINNGEIYWLLLFDRGRIAANEGDLAEAVKRWREAVEIIEQQRSSINTEANKIGFAGDKQAVYRHLIGGLYATGQFAEAFDYLERSKSRALVDMLASKKDFAVATGDAEKIRELLAQADKNEIAALGQGAEKRSATRGIVAPTESLRQQAPELATLVSVSATPLTDIQAKLRPDETLVEYYYDSQWLYAFVLNRESLRVVRMVPQSRALLRKEANETMLRKYGQGFRYLHFATHGEFKADNPLASALFLSKDAQDDGLLTVGKLYSMRFDTDLVTLSACETGLGKIANGDDVVGLTRGFLYAGAATIVASLWKVDDQATSDLMRAFYTNLGQTGKLDALRNAQLEIKRKYPPPYFWAPFQLLGNPDGGQYVAAKAPEPPAPVAVPLPPPTRKPATTQKTKGR